VPEDGLEVMPVNARHVKNVPGTRPTSAMPNGRPDPAHAALVRGSFAPPEPIRRLRDLTRARTRLTGERSREVRRL
jgi:hypothetical protein